MPIPDHLDVANALEDLAAGLRLGPEGREDQLWVCVLHGPTGVHSAGVGLTQREAASDAWVASWTLPQLIDAVLGRAPPPLPDGRFTFELAAPGDWERVYATVPHATGRG
jgi:hypothetical protein